MNENDGEFSKEMEETPLRNHCQADHVFTSIPSLIIVLMVLLLVLQSSPHKDDKDETVYRVADVLRKAQEQRKLLDENVHNILRKRKEINAFLDPPNSERYLSFIPLFLNLLESSRLHPSVEDDEIPKTIRRQSLLSA